MKYTNITGDSVRHEILVILNFTTSCQLRFAVRNYVFISTEISLRERKLDNVIDNVNRNKVSTWLWIERIIHLPRLPHTGLNSLNHSELYRQ